MVVSLASSSAPTAASPLPGPEALVRADAVMIPVSGSITIWALNPSWRLA